MRNDFLLFVLILISISSVANAQQHVFKVKADTASITNAELILENKTKDTLGFLYNKGNGRTEFRRVLVKLNNNTFIIGNDTLTLVSSGSSDLQSVTNGGKKTTNSIWSKSLIVGDTAKQLYADSTGTLVGGNIRSSGTISADSSGSFAFGAVDSGSIKASSKGAIATGYTSTNAGLIQSRGYGAFARGAAKYISVAAITNPSQIIATADGSMASGITFGGKIQAIQGGAHAFGGAQNGSILKASNYGSIAMGYAQGNSINIANEMTASGSGAVVMGYLNNSATTGSPVTMIASGNGSFLHGYAASRSSLLASGHGSFVSGRTQIKGSIQATSDGSIAMGFVSDSLANGSYSWIKSTGLGSFAAGYAGFAGHTDIGFINSNGRGSWATGWAQGNGTITANVDAAYAGGHINGTGLIFSGAAGAYAFGDVSGTDSIYTTGAGSYLLGGKLYNTGTYSQLFGFGLRNTTNNVFKVGYNKDYIVADGTSGTVTIGVPTSTNSDVEITDATKGVIFKTSTGQRVRMTITVTNGVPTPVYTIL